MSSTCHPLDPRIESYVKREIENYQKKNGVLKKSDTDDIKPLVNAKAVNDLKFVGLENQQSKNESLFSLSDLEDEDEQEVVEQKPTLSEYDRKRIEEKKRKREQEEEEASALNYNEESTLRLDLQVKISILMENSNRAFAGKTLEALDKRGKIIPILKAAVAEVYVDREWLSKQFCYQRVGETEENICTQAMMELAEHVSNSARHRSYNMENITNRLQKIHFHQLMKIDELSRKGFDFVREQLATKRSSRGFGIIPYDDPNRYVKKSRMMTQIEERDNDDNDDQGDIEDELHAQNYADYDEENNYEDYQPEDSRYNDYDETNDHSYDNCWNSNNYNENENGYYQHYSDEFQDQGECSAYDSKNWEQPSSRMDLSELYISRRAAREKAAGQPLTSEKHLSTPTTTGYKRIPEYKVKDPSRANQMKNSKKQKIQEPSLNELRNRPVAKIVETIQDLVRTIFDPFAKPMFSIYGPRHGKLAKANKIRFKIDPTKVPKDFPDPTVTLLTRTTQKFTTKNLENDGTEILDPSISFIIPSSDCPVKQPTRKNPHVSYERQRANQMKAAIFSNLSSSLRTQTRARNLLIHDSILKTLDPGIFLTRNSERNEFGGNTIKVDLSFPNMLPWFIDALNNWYEAEKESDVAFPCAQVFLAIGMDIKAYYVGINRKENVEVLQFLDNVKKWFESKTSTSRTDDDICVRYVPTRTETRDMVQIQQRLWRVSYMPKLVLVTIPEIGTCSRPFSGLNEEYRKFVENSEDFSLLDWAALCKDKAELAETVEGRTKILVEEMSDTYGVLYR